MTHDYYPVRKGWDISEDIRDHFTGTHYIQVHSDHVVGRDEQMQIMAQYRILYYDVDFVETNSRGMTTWNACGIVEWQGSTTPCPEAGVKKVNDDIDGDEAMRRFEELGTKLFQIKKDHVEEITEGEPDDYSSRSPDE